MTLTLETDKQKGYTNDLGVISDVFSFVSVYNKRDHGDINKRQENAEDQEISWNSETSIVGK